MSRKVFSLTIELDVHAITCPGVWLCPKGKVRLRVTMLGSVQHTEKKPPAFPLVFHERFTFCKIFDSVTCLTQLQNHLANKPIQLILIQYKGSDTNYGLHLATFKTALSELLYPAPVERGLVAGVDVDLLMDPTSCFPGILSPKVEVSTRVVIEEIINYPISCKDWIINPMTVSSKKTALSKSEMSATTSRQKKVCHVKQNKCCYCKRDPPFKCHPKEKGGRSRKREMKGMPSTHVCCTNACGKSLGQWCCCDINIKPRSSSVGDCDVDSDIIHSNVKCRVSRSQSSCKCRLCHKYSNYFMDPNGKPASARNRRAHHGTNRNTSPINKEFCSRTLRSGSSQNMRGCSPQNVRECSPRYVRDFSPQKVLTSRHVGECSPNKMRNISPPRLRGCSPSRLRGYSPTRLRGGSPSRLRGGSPSCLRVGSPNVKRKENCYFHHCCNKSGRHSPLTAQHHVECTGRHNTPTTQRQHVECTGRHSPPTPQHLVECSRGHSPPTAQRHLVGWTKEMTQDSACRSFGEQYGGAKAETNCGCGVYSCPHSKKTFEPEVDPLELGGSVGGDFSSYRYTFYKYLESYYRKLYNRAKQRSALHQYS